MGGVLEDSSHCCLRFRVGLDGGVKVLTYSFPRHEEPTISPSLPLIEPRKRFIVAVVISP
jgi:hypothetical protein